jgi:DNA-binding CsgD family transcriptional regulator
MSISMTELTALLEANTVADLYAGAKAASGSLEVDHFIYGIRLNPGSGEGREFVLSGYPNSWRQLYEREHYVAIDPTVAHAVSSTLPLVWSELLFVESGASALMEDARQFGLRSGMTIPLHSSNLEVGLMSFVRDTPRMSLLESSHLMGQAQLFATYLHEGARRLLERREEVQNITCRLTPRERECLTWVAAGKSSWDIGKIAALSERTVNFHIGNVMKKLNVTSRSQAVARALAGGLIQM